MVYQPCHTVVFACGYTAGGLTQVECRRESKAEDWGGRIANGSGEWPSQKHLVRVCAERSGKSSITRCASRWTSKVPHRWPLRQAQSSIPLAWGERADLFLDSHRTVPQVALSTGFQFRFPTLSEALSDLLGPHPIPIAQLMQLIP
jgi:Domain of unknown function (DUF1731)